MKILGFTTSNNKNSINKELVQFVGSELNKKHEFKYLDISEYNLPIYNQDIEEENGIPKEATQFYQEIKDSDVVVLSLAEHNGNYTAFFKNLFDWTSRIDMKVYQDKKVIVLSTSPGPGGASSVLKTFNDSAGFFGANIIASRSLPSFYENFKDNKVTESDFLTYLNNIEI